MTANIYIQLAEIAEEVSAKTSQVQSILEDVKALKAKEAELQSSIGLKAMTAEEPKVRRGRLRADTVADIRRRSIGIMRESAMWMPLGLIADEVTKMFPNITRLAVENQIRALISVPDNNIWHNGKRTISSMYRWSESRPSDI